MTERIAAKRSAPQSDRKPSVTLRYVAVGRSSRSLPLLPAVTSGCDRKVRRYSHTLPYRLRRRLPSRLVGASTMLHARHHRPDFGQIDLVVAGVELLVGVGQRRLAVLAACRAGNHPLVGRSGQVPPAALTSNTACTWAGSHRLVRPVLLLALRGGHPGIVRGLAGPGQIVDPCLQLSNQISLSAASRRADSVRISSSFSVWETLLRPRAAITQVLELTRPLPRQAK